MQKIAACIAALAVSGCTNLPSRHPIHLLGVSEVERTNHHVFCDAVDIVGGHSCVKASPKTIKTTLSVMDSEKEEKVDTHDIDAVFRNEPIAVVNFDFKNSVLKEEEKQKLDEVFNKNHHGKKLLLRGYTDNIGVMSFNTTLAMSRALSVKNYLISKEFSDANLQALGFGLCCYVVANTTTDGREKNRRVEIYIDGR